MSGLVKPAARCLIVLVVLLAVILAAGAALAQSSGYSISWWVVAGGGSTGVTGGVYAVQGTSGQAGAGTLSGGAYTLDGGFWGGLAAGHSVYLPVSTFNAGP